MPPSLREGDRLLERRRAFLAWAAVLVGHLLAARPSRAAMQGAAALQGEALPAWSRHDAAYQDRPKNGITCGQCSFYLPPNACNVVEGRISRNGSCKLFDLAD